MEGSCHQTKTVSKHKFARFYVPLGIYTGSILDKSLKNRQSIDEVTFITDKIPKLLSMLRNWDDGDFSTKLRTRANLRILSARKPGNQSMINARPEAGHIRACIGIQIRKETIA